ncbi:hypothetical protein KW800_00410 [Candidatus Parcubacteria bacterium]|nr:hypothetical protein [Candidatus Parcubacteria bacterium]
MKRFFALCVVALCSACADASAPDPYAVVLDAPLNYEGVSRSMATRPIEILDIPTRDSQGRLLSAEKGGGQVVHPSFLGLDKPFRGERSWMAVNPYPWGSTAAENPMLLVLRDTVTLVEPSGIENPLIRKPEMGFNSDVNIVYDEGAKGIFMSNREVVLGYNTINSRSAIGNQTFGEQSTILKEPSHTLVSQSITYGAGGVPMFYSVNAGGDGCTSKLTWIELRKPVEFTPGTPLTKLSLGYPVMVELEQPGYTAWHGEFKWVKPLSLYVGMITAYPDSLSCGRDDLFLATSRDGVTFTTYPMPLMWRRNPWMQVVAVYKTTFTYDESKKLLRMWLSVLTYAPKLRSGEWHLWYMAYHWPTLISELESERKSGGFTNRRYTRLLTRDHTFDRLMKGVIMP